MNRVTYRQSSENAVVLNKKIPPCGTSPQQIVLSANQGPFAFSEGLCASEIECPGSEEALDKRKL